MHKSISSDAPLPKSKRFFIADILVLVSGAPFSSNKKRAKDVQAGSPSAAG